MTPGGWAVLAALAVAAPPSLHPQAVAWPAGPVVRGTLSFDGRSSLGDFTGSTTSVQGAMTGGATLAAVRGHVEAPVASLRTGNDRRDRDLLKTMDAAVYPHIRFELEGVTPEWERGDSASVWLEGRFVIHGVARAERVRALVTRVPGGLAVRADLPMNLHDYRVDRLRRFLVFRMEPDITVHVDLVFAPTGS